MLPIELLQVALGKRERLSCVPTDAEWNRIYRWGDMHSLVGVLFGGIERLPKEQHPGKDLLMDWLAQAEYIKMKNEEVNKDCETVTKLFRDAGFRTSIMKGQGNARLYGDLSLLRNSGDIDIWVAGGFEKVNGFVQTLYKTNEINELEIQLHVVCETPVEVHYHPFIMRNPWMNRRLQKFFADEAESCFRNGLYTTVRFNLVHQLAHVRLHLFTEGIGLRQLVDYYFLLVNSKEDKVEMMRIIDHLGMKRFAEAMMWVMKEVFLLPEDMLLCRTDANGGLLLLQDVMKGGNFGRHDMELNERKRQSHYYLWALLVRNLRYNRFDRWDWLCGPMWRIYHRIWRMVKGFK